MERASTLFLKVTVLLIGIPIVALCIGLPWIAKEAADLYPAQWLYPVLVGMYGSAIPFFIALYQAFGLLSYIDRNQAFSELSVGGLKKIKYCAVAIAVLYAACLPFLYLMAERVDAPGLLALGLVISFASLVIAVFAAVLQMLLKNAIEIKSENDLTV